MNSTSTRAPTGRKGPATRLALLSRCVAVFGGGYAVAAAVTMLLTLALPLPRGEAALTAMLLSFPVMVGAIIALFLLGTAQRAWLGAVLAAGPALLLVLVLG